MTTPSREQRYLLVGTEFPPDVSLQRSKRTHAVVVEFREGLAGAWTVMRSGIEVVQFGYPAASRNRWFQIFTPGRTHNAATLALERMLFARRITTLVICDCSVEKIALKASAVHRDHLKIVSRRNDEPLAAVLKGL